MPTLSPTLSKEQRRFLEKKVAAARRAAEAGAKAALDQLGIADPRPRAALSREERDLHPRLRARGRQLGDLRESRTGAQSIGRLAEAVAYEHWHRLLFARFLAESGFLHDPATRVPIALDEVHERARTRGQDWMALAAEYARPMLLNVFRPNDPILELRLPPETRQAMEAVLDSVPREIFLADDSLGWVYQFWQSERKSEVNKSEVKIGADEIAPVTQLFTDDYMVLFLLHNTLGAWWTAKRRAEGKSTDLPGYKWEYLRLNDDGSPAAGPFDGTSNGDSAEGISAGKRAQGISKGRSAEGISEGNSANEAGWPRAARDLHVLDPCMGSGHFLVFALPIIARMRMEEEGLSLEEALAAVLRDNLFGLEIDDRCSQIAAFNLALTAWRIAGRQFPLPALNLACSGLHINAPLADWLKLAQGDELLENSLKSLYALFQQAPLLGSLIDPRQFDKKIGGNLFGAPFERVRPMLEVALAAEAHDHEQQEMAVAARGLLAASRILAGEYTLVATNVPYLGRRKQTKGLKQFCEDHYTAGKADLATCFVVRCLALCNRGGSVALVTPQAWLFLKTYRELRKSLLGSMQWDFVARLGPHAFEAVTGEVVSVALVGLTRRVPAAEHALAAWDASAAGTAGEKAHALQTEAASRVSQASQHANPDSIVSGEELDATRLVSNYGFVRGGITSGDSPHFRQRFWEVDASEKRWVFQQSTVNETCLYGGREFLLLWQDGHGDLTSRVGSGATIAGREAWRRKGVAISYMRDLKVTLYTGEIFENVICVLVPKTENLLLPLWAFCSSQQFRDSIRDINRKLSVDVGYFEKADFDLAHWRPTGARQFPHGLPAPHSDDPTQWLFNGCPKGSDAPLQAAVARLLGYRWPRQTGSSFMDCPALGPDGLEKHAIADGIACLAPLAGQAAAAARLRGLLQAAYGAEWSHQLLKNLIGDDLTLDDWLRDRFFAEHCELFHQRPFIWHVWDGRADGFHALVNYHKLAGENGEGRRTLERLIYIYLGEWIARQEAEARAETSGAEGRLVAARHLKAELEKIARGEAPYDIFVRWKPLSEQPVGWEPDINDGVRLNIRPWLSAKTYQAAKAGTKNACILRVMPKIRYGVDRGREPARDAAQFPWFSKNPGKRDNDVHLTLAEKAVARTVRAQSAGGAK